METRSGRVDKMGSSLKFPSVFFCLPTVFSLPAYGHLKVWPSTPQESGLYQDYSALVPVKSLLQKQPELFGVLSLEQLWISSNYLHKSMKWLRILCHPSNSRSIFNQSWKFTSYSYLNFQPHCSTEHIINLSIKLVDNKIPQKEIIQGEYNRTTPKPELPKFEFKPHPINRFMKGYKATNRAIFWS